MQAELLNPVVQLVRGATTTVELVVESSDTVNATYVDSGGYLAFGRAGEPMTVLSAIQSRARQTGNNEVGVSGMLSGIVHQEYGIWCRQVRHDSHAQRHGLSAMMELFFFS